MVENNKKEERLEINNYGKIEKIKNEDRLKIRKGSK